MSEVQLNVYDLTNGLARQMSHSMIGHQIDGVWHTGVVVYGREFFFGGGICEAVPKATPYGHPVKEVKMGTTEIPEELFREYLASISPEYTPEKYDIINHNCNNFSDEICHFLLGKGIPEDIVGLPKELLSTPLGQMVGPMIQSITDNIKEQSFGYSLQQPIPAPRPAPHFEDSKGPVKEISSYSQFEALLKDSLGVVADFWSPSCGPCMMFKPIYHSFAEANKDSKIAFCAINTLNNRETASAYQIRAIPTIYFFYKGNLVGSFTGANQQALLTEYAKLKKQVDETHPHMSISFKNFIPDANEIQLENSQKQTAGMIKSISDLIEASASKEVLKDLLAWIKAESFGKINSCNNGLMDNIFSLIKETEFEKRLSLIDLLRLTVIYNKGSCLHMFNSHFEDIQDLLISPTVSQLETPTKKTFFFFAYILKVFSNSFAHPPVAKLLMADTKFYAMLIYLLTSAFDTKNSSVVYSASILAHNMVVAADSRKALEENVAELVQGLAKATAIEKLDPATMYWLGYACALCLYTCPVTTLKEVKAEASFTRMLEIMRAMDNDKVKKLGEDITAMVSI